MRIWDRIRATSGGAGQDTRFPFTLPMAEEVGYRTPTGDMRYRSGAVRAEEQVRILVVDDDPQTLRYVGDTLAAVDYVPVVTGDSRELDPPHQNEGSPRIPGRPCWTDAARDRWDRRWRCGTGRRLSSRRRRWRSAHPACRY